MEHGTFTPRKSCILPRVFPGTQFGNHSFRHSKGSLKGFQQEDEAIRFLFASWPLLFLMAHWGKVIIFPQSTRIEGQGCSSHVWVGAQCDQAPTHSKGRGLQCWPTTFLSWRWSKTGGLEHQGQGWEVISVAWRQWDGEHTGSGDIQEAHAGHLSGMAKIQGLWRWNLLGGLHLAGITGVTQVPSAKTSIWTEEITLLAPWTWLYTSPLFYNGNLTPPPHPQLCWGSCQLLTTSYQGRDTPTLALSATAAFTACFPTKIPFLKQ